MAVSLRGRRAGRAGPTGRGTRPVAQPEVHHGEISSVGDQRRTGSSRLRTLFGIEFSSRNFAGALDGAGAVWRLRAGLQHFHTGDVSLSGAAARALIGFFGYDL